MFSKYLFLNSKLEFLNNFPDDGSIFRSIAQGNLKLAGGRAYVLPLAFSSQARYSNLRVIRGAMLSEDQFLSQRNSLSELWSLSKVLFGWYSPSGLLFVPTQQLELSLETDRLIIHC